MNLKFWQWRRKKQKPKPKTEKKLESISPVITKEVDKHTSETVTRLHPPNESVDKKIFTSRNLVMISTEADLFFSPCEVLDDHRIRYKKNRKWKEVKIMQPPHTMTLPLRDILPSFLNRRLSGKFARYRVYTVQAEGEITHDPHRVEIDPELLKRFEKLLQLEGEMAKAEFAKQINSGMQRRKKWEDYIPWLVMGGTTVFMIFAFQIAPNLG